MRKAIHIEWDVDDQEDLKHLPDSIDIPDDVNNEDIGDYISDLTGFCFYGCEITYQ